MQWLQSVFGSDGSPIVQYVSIFAVIFAVLTVIVLVVRRLGGGGLADAKRAGQRGRQPRLGIVDVYELDRQRQLILLRRDNVEHLLLVGGPNDVVIERHIQRGQARDPALRPEAMAEPMGESMADSLAEAFAAPAAGSFAGLGTRAETTFQPDFAMPVVLAPPVPGSGAMPPVTHPLDPVTLDAAEPGAGRASEAVVAGPRPEAPPTGRRPMRRTTPPLINPRPDVASERPRAELASRPDESAFAVGVVTPMSPAERRPVDPAILSDMARQLEAALARPASAVAPSPVRPAPSEASPVPVPAPVPDAPAAVDPVAAAMAVPADVAVAPVAPPGAAPVEQAAPPDPEPEPFLPAPPQPEAAPQPAPVATAEPPSPPPVAPALPPVEPPRAAQPAPKPAANPFSVEEIEAEFARLLGRPLDKRN